MGRSKKNKQKQAEYYNVPSEKPLIWKTALYIRLSREDGRNGNNSIKNQRQMLLEYVNTHPAEFELAGLYVDDGKTGTDSNRFEFQRMLRDIDNGKVNCVIVKDPSRLSRNYIEAGTYLEQIFVEKDVRFISLGLPAIDSLKNPELMNGLTLRITNIVNDEYARATSEKIRKVFESKRAKGEFFGAFAAYGYLKDPDNKYHLIPDPAAGQIVADMYQWVKSGSSAMQVVRKLNELGIPSPKTYKQEVLKLNYQCNTVPADIKSSLWTLRTVKRILTDPVNIGCVTQGKEQVKSYKVHKRVSVPGEKWISVSYQHEPLIDEETFHIVQTILDKDIKASQNTKQVYLFSGFLRCPDCGRGLTRRSSKNYVYYACRTYKYQSKTACSNHSIREDVLEKAVLDSVNNQIQAAHNLEKLLKEAKQHSTIKKRCGCFEKLLESKENELCKKIACYDSLYFDLKEKIIEKEQYKRLKTKLEKEITILKSNISKLKEEMQMAEQDKKEEPPCLIEFMKYKQVKNLNRNLLSELIDKIFVHEDKSIEIIYNFDDPY